MTRSHAQLRGGVLLLSLLVGVLGLSTSAFAETVEFKPESPEKTHEFTVPPGVTQIEVLAAGGSGGKGGNCAGDGSVGAGGSGAMVAATLAVEAGEVLYVDFGGGGAGGFPSD